MQTSITKISMKINSEESPVKAYVSIVLNNSVKINGIKLVCSENGKLIVVLPENSEKKIQYVVPIKELADNIEACGLLHPITVNKIAPDNYQIISGERRFRAVTEYLHWKSVPCMVFDGLSAEAAQLKLCMANLAVREYTASQKYRFYLEVKALLEKNEGIR